MKRLAWILVVAACGGDANVEGDYTVALTNRDNACNLANWTVGTQTTGVQATVTQEGENVTLTVTGLAGVAVSALLGTNVYIGAVDGDEIDLSITGETGFNTGNCAYTYNSTIQGTLDGDTLSGRIEYRAATNDQSDCGELTGCLSYQDFNGARPPP